MFLPGLVHDCLALYCKGKKLSALMDQKEMHKKQLSNSTF